MRTATIVSLLAAAVATVSAEGYCNAGETQMCCQNLTDYNVGYYCGTPDQAFPCTGSSPPLSAMCCTGYDLTPRGYTGSNCRRVEVGGAQSSSAPASSAPASSAAASSPTVAPPVFSSSAVEVVPSSTPAVEVPAPAETATKKPKVCKKKKAEKI